MILLAIILGVIAFNIWYWYWFEDGFSQYWLGVLSLILLPVIIFLLPAAFLPIVVTKTDIPVTVVKNTNYNLVPISKVDLSGNEVTFINDVTSTDDIYVERFNDFHDGNLWTTFGDIPASVNSRYEVHIPKDFDIDRLQIKDNAFKYVNNDTDED